MSLYIPQGVGPRDQSQISHHILGTCAAKPWHDVVASHTFDSAASHATNDLTYFTQRRFRDTARDLCPACVCENKCATTYIYICIFYIINCHPGLHKPIFSNVHTYSHSQNLLNVPESAQVFHRTFSLVYSQTGYDTDVFSA